MTTGGIRSGPFRRLLGALSDATPAFASDPAAEAGLPPAGFVRRLLIALSDSSPAFQRVGAAPGSVSAEAPPGGHDVPQPDTRRTNLAVPAEPSAQLPEPTPPSTPTLEDDVTGSPLPRPAPRRGDLSRKRRPTVLVVEDDPILSYTLRLALERSDFAVVDTAADGRQAVDLVDLHRPDLVTMDIMLPVMDGWEAARAISERYPATRVVMVTARASDQENLLQALALGAVGFLTKPFSMDELSATLREAVDGGFPIAPAIAATLRSPEGQGWLLSSEPKFFTDVESAVLRHLSENRSVREIAERTGFTAHEVREIQVLLTEKIKLRSSLESDQPG